MTVELAALLPVTLVCGLIVMNLMQFVVACARFDRVALDAVVSQGVSAAGDQDSLTAVADVRSAIVRAMGDDERLDLEVSVAAAEDGTPSEGAVFSLATGLVRFTCTLRFHPWPREVSIAGVSMGAPLSLVHERQLVVDRYKPGVVV
jgi:hypothetical protein